MTAKCEKCKRFLPNDATSEICLECQTKAALQNLSEEKGATTATPVSATSLFRFEIPVYVHGQTGGIKTWLRQVEVRLKLAKITGEQEKYEYLVAALPSEIISRVYDLVNTQPAVEPFTSLIKRIESEFQPTESEQIKKLLQGMMIGDKKPTLFLREMRELAKGLVSDTVLRELFLNQLPQSLKDILVVIESASLESLAEAADRGWQSAQASVIASTSVTPAPTQPVEGVEKKIDDLMGKMIEVLNHMSRSDERSFQRRDSRNRSPTPGPYGKNKNYRGRSRSRNRGGKKNPNWTVCWAHHRFGDKARTCENWCERWCERGSNATASSQGNGSG